MKITGLHFLLTYICNFRCDHCFAFGSPGQEGVMGLDFIEQALDQVVETKSITGVYFEGGEPFLYYPILKAGVEMAVDRSLTVGIVTNAYWATDNRDAREWLTPLQGKINDLSISIDSHHGGNEPGGRGETVQAVAKSLDLPVGCIAISPVCREEGDEGSDINYRGRAAVELAPKAEKYRADKFTECPHEDLADPGRLHLDPYGNLFSCQGIIYGNLLDQPLKDIVDLFDPDKHPIVGPLIRGGPLELAQSLGHDIDGGQYADACHLCYTVRNEFRKKYPKELGPGNVYGEFD